MEFQPSCKGHVIYIVQGSREQSIYVTVLVVKNNCSEDKFNDSVLKLYQSFCTVLQRKQLNLLSLPVCPCVIYQANQPFEITLTYIQAMKYNVKIIDL